MRVPCVPHLIEISSYREQRIIKRHYKTVLMVLVFPACGDSRLQRKEDVVPDWFMTDYSENSLAYWPSHVDATYDFKYGVRLVQGGGRSSAQETIGRVSAGVAAKKILELKVGTVQSSKNGTTKYGSSSKWLTMYLPSRTTNESSLEACVASSKVDSFFKP